MDARSDALARRLLALWRTGRQETGLEVADMAAAGRVTARLRALREDRGERVVGRKIGFTNTTLWARYGVTGPMWSYVWDSTVVAAGPDFDLTGLPEPRIEPEIVFRIGAPPAPVMDEAALLACVAAVTHGFEIVQSPHPGWRFSGPGAAAAFGLHGGLILGPWRAIGPTERPRWRAALADCAVSLWRGDVEVEAGRASNVLGGPLTALRFLVETLAADAQAAQLAAGEIVSTGTMTDAHPVAPGETWRSAISGAPLDGLQARFA